MEPEEDIIAEVCGACAKTNCMNLCPKLRAAIGGSGRRAIVKDNTPGMIEWLTEGAADNPKTTRPARRRKISAWENNLRAEAYSARGEDTPEKIEWFKKGIARRRQELFSMDMAETE